MTKKRVEDTYRKLSEVEHVLKRPGRYLGAIEPETVSTYIVNDDNKVEWRNVKYSPAFLKLFDEIISNSVDYSKRVEGKHLKKIDVEVDRDTGAISVYDDGGIPVVKHSEYDQYVPDMIFGELRSGSNFDDEEDSISTGQNGEGSTLTVIFSKEFTVDTADGHNRFVCTYKDNLSRKTAPVVKPSTKHYTKITYVPDYERLGVTLDQDHYSIICRRVHEIAATNTHLRVYLNGTQIKYKSFTDFAKLFSDNRVDFGTPRMEFSVFHSKEGFQQIGFVNCTNVFNGGTHVDYIMKQIVSDVRAHVKKKTKQDVKPSDIQNHFFLMSNLTLNNPRYSSQTKENLTTPPRDYGTSYTVDAKVLKKILQSDIVAEIIEWAENKQKLEELAALKKKNKDVGKGSLKDIIKYEPANSKERDKCILFIAEGDAAAKPMQSARNPQFHGIYPVKGKPINVRGIKVKDLIENVELNQLMRIIGLQFGVEPELEDLRYQHLVVSTDQDLDGYHLAGLFFNMFEQLWPELLKKGFLKKLQTPIIRVKQGNQEIEFMNLNEFYEWEKIQTKAFTSNYLKGLGSNDTVYFKKYMFDPKYMLDVTYGTKSDVEALSIAFDKSRSDDRKEYLYGA